MHRSLVALCSILAAATVTAQAVTLPPEATQWPGNRHNSSVLYASTFGPNEARTQLLYPLTDIPATLTAIQQIDFRSLGTIGNSAATVYLEISISTSPRDPDDPSSTFAVNAPTPAVPVFAGTVSMPAAPFGTWPRPWDVQIPLQTPFALAPAAGDQSLVIDVKTSNSTGLHPWWVEQYGTSPTANGQGSQVLSQPGCLLPNGQTQMQSSHQPNLLHPGGRLALTLGLYPNNQPSAAANVLVIGLQAQGGTIAGQTLPTPLSSFGLPTPPNCLWTVENAMAIPITYNSYSWGGSLTTDQLVPIPNLAGLAGMTFYAQNAALLSYPNGLQFFPSVAMQFTIGDSVTPSGSTITAPSDQNATTGTVSTAGPVSIRLQ